MFHYLYLVRHATAEDGGFFTDDFARELTPEGIIEAARMARFLQESKNVVIDALYCSAAARTHKTAQVMAEQLRFDSEKIITDRALYDEGPKAYLRTLNQITNAQSAMIVGHNPDISFFAEYLTKADIGSMQKSAVAVVAFDNVAWSEMSAYTGKLVEYLSPR